MAVKIVEHASRSDVGRQREHNEDSFYESAPIFAVADGMGGAQAGEVASKLAVDSFGSAPPGDMPPEQHLEQIARAANKRIYEMAQEDDTRRGMGTTLTALFVGDGEVSIGHVGDSRAYRLRDGELEQLTHDHSLVAELERSGQLSPEDAENHPQKSIITRALGPEPDVNVDTTTHAARPGDVYMLCSDGLTGMLTDDEVLSILRGASSLSDAGESLIRAANQSGGKDNITVVLFRLGEGDDDGESPPAVDQATIVGTVKAADIQEEAIRRQTTVAAPADEDPRAAPTTPRPVKRPPARPPKGGKRRRVGTAVKVTLGLLVLAGVVVAGYAASRQAYFVGTNDSGLVTLYRGLPYELPLGVDLYEEEYASGVPARAIPARRRDRVLDHEIRGKNDATDLLRDIEQGRLEN